MPSVLVSGPAGAGKSQHARRLVEEGAARVWIDFQRIHVALSGDRRDPETGRYPYRDPALLPLVEYVRQVAIRQARRRELDMVVTNADGSPERRFQLLARMHGEPEDVYRDVFGVQPGQPIDSREIVLDPGEATVRKRLADPATGVLANACELAIGRWYRRL